MKIVNMKMKKKIGRMEFAKQYATKNTSVFYL